MKALKSISVVLLSVFLVASLLSCTANGGTNKPITVELDGTSLSFDVEPQCIDGRVLVPLRKIFEELGAFVKWNEETQTVSARRNKKTVTLTIGSADMQVSKGDVDEAGNAVTETVMLDVPAQVTEDRTMVPVRAISEAFGLEVVWSEDANLVSIFSKKDEDDSWKNNQCTIDLSNLSCEGEGVTVSNNQVLITKGGDYTLSGTLNDGNITVRTDEKVKLRLSGVSVTSSKEPCIYVEEAEKAYITLSEDTENTLTAESAKGAIYAKENLEIKGGGKLTINATEEHGIKASDNLTIEAGTIAIHAAGDGIHVNDTFRMSGGILSIDSVGDGIDAESIAVIENGVVCIKTNGEPLVSTEDTGDMFRERPGFPGGPNEIPDVEFETSSKGIKAEWLLCIRGGDVTTDSADHAIHCADEMEITGGKLLLNSEYGKGISGHGNVLIDGENTVIDITKATEGIESKNILTVKNGTISIYATDDGINATGGVSGEMPGMPPGEAGNGMQPRDFGGMQRPPVPEGGEPFKPDGNMNEMQRPPVPEGDMPPQGQRGEMRRGGKNPGEGAPPEGEPHNREDGENRRGGGRNQKNCLIINGGELTVRAGDDCFDSNGSIMITGGVIKAVKTNGTMTGNNSIFDAEGQVAISGSVTIIAAGNGGRLDIPQNCITVYGETSCQAGTAITLCKADGNVMAEYTPSDAFSAVFVSSPDLNIGESYTVKVGDNAYSVTLSEQNTVIGTPKNQERQMFSR